VNLRYEKKAWKEEEKIRDAIEEFSKYKKR
jgi:hypothetical protein